jgi:putative redox protein
LLQIDENRRPQLFGAVAGGRWTAAESGVKVEPACEMLTRVWPDATVAFWSNQVFFERGDDMVEMQIRYTGGLRCLCKHMQSGTELNTDAPRDNMGKGESFSPTDLVATALGSCMLTTMAIVAQRHDIDLTGSTVVATKEMVAAPTRRIGTLGVTLNIPVKLSPEDRQRLENAAYSCPVHKSLHPDVKIPVTFNWA